MDALNLPTAALWPVRLNREIRHVSLIQILTEDLDADHAPPLAPWRDVQHELLASLLQAAVDTAFPEGLAPDAYTRLLAGEDHSAVQDLIDPIVAALAALRGFNLTGGEAFLQAPEAWIEGALPVAISGLLEPLAPKAGGGAKALRRPAQEFKRLGATATALALFYYQAVLKGGLHYWSRGILCNATLLHVHVGATLRQRLFAAVLPRLEGDDGEAPGGWTPLQPFPWVTDGARRPPQARYLMAQGERLAGTADLRFWMARWVRLFAPESGTCELTGRRGPVFSGFHNLAEPAAHRRMLAAAGEDAHRLPASAPGLLAGMYAVPASHPAVVYQPTRGDGQPPLLLLYGPAADVTRHAPPWTVLSTLNAAETAQPALLRALAARCPPEVLARGGRLRFLSTRFAPDVLEDVDSLVQEEYALPSLEWLSQAYLPAAATAARILEGQVRELLDAAVWGLEAQGESIETHPRYAKFFGRRTGAEVDAAARRRARRHPLARALARALWETAWEQLGAALSAPFDRFDAPAWQAQAQAALAAVAARRWRAAMDRLLDRQAWDLRDLAARIEAGRRVQGALKRAGQPREPVDSTPPPWVAAGRAFAAAYHRLAPLQRARLRRATAPERQAAFQTCLQAAEAYAAPLPAALLARALPLLEDAGSSADGASLGTVLRRHAALIPQRQVQDLLSEGTLERLLERAEQILVQTRRRYRSRLTLDFGVLLADLHRAERAPAEVRLGWLRDFFWPAPP